jgi:hypothetical protein
MSGWQLGNILHIYRAALPLRFVILLSNVLLLDHMYLRIILMEPENQEKYRNGNNNESERKLKDT